MAGKNIKIRLGIRLKCEYLSDRKSHTNIQIHKYGYRFRLDGSMQEPFDLIFFNIELLTQIPHII